MQSACAVLCCLLWPVSLYHIFSPTFSHQRHDFWETVNEYKICVLIFSTKFVGNIFRSKKNSAGYFRNLYIGLRSYLDAGLLVISQYLDGPATGHLDTGFSWFPCVYKRMLRWFPSFQVATTCFSCSPPDLNFLVTFFFHICVHVK